MSDVTTDLRLEIQKGLETIWELDDEASVRNHVSAINSLIARTQIVSLCDIGDRIPLLQTVRRTRFLWTRICDNRVRRRTGYDEGIEVW